MSDARYDDCRHGVGYWRYCAACAQSYKPPKLLPTPGEFGKPLALTADTVHGRLFACFDSGVIAYYQNHEWQRVYP